MRKVINPNKVINNFQKKTEKTASIFATKVPKLILLEGARKELIEEARTNNMTLDETLSQYSDMLVRILRNHQGDSGTVAILELAKIRSLH